MPEENIFLRFVKEGKIEFTKDGKIIGFNEYAIFLPVRALNRLFILLKENLGEDKAKEILKELGKFQVRQALQRYLKILSWREVTKDEILKFAKHVMILIGLGTYEFLKENNLWVILIKKTPFAEEFTLEYGQQKKPIDYYISGIWELFFTSLIGKPMVCEEVKCYAKGDDCCEFVVKPKEETEEKETK